MARFVIRTINCSFDVTDEGAEYPSVEAAYAAALSAGLAIATDEIKEGRTIALIEICVEDTAGERHARGIVSVATSPLANS